MEIVETRDRDRIEAFWRRDTPAHLYALADLDELFFDDCRWFVRQDRGETLAMCLLLDKLSLPILYAVCPADHEATRALVEHVHRELPERFFFNLGPGLLSAFADYRLDSEGEHRKLWLADPARPDAVDTSRVERLGPDQRAELERFYRERAYAPEENASRFLEPYMIERWPFFGIREDARLVCAGGTHVFSARYRVAALGNIATSPACRGRGLARAVTARLCQELRPQVDCLGLNVQADNAPAIRCYEGLGFELACRYTEGTLERRG